MLAAPPEGCATISRADQIALCKEVLRVAFRVDDALPDLERQQLLRGFRSHMPALAMSLRDRQAAFGIDAALEADKEAKEIQARRSRRIALTAHNLKRWEIGMGWATWLKQQNNGPRDFRLLRSWARGASLVAIAGRAGQSDDTIGRWIREAIEAIISKPPFRRELEALV